MYTMLISVLLTCFGSVQAQDLDPLPEDPPESMTPTNASPGSAELAPGPADPTQRRTRLTLEDLVHASDLEPGLVVVIVDPDNLLRDQVPSGRFGRGENWTELHFSDDGQSPDGVARDRQFVARAPLGEQRGMTELRLYGADDSLLYQDEQIPLPWERPLPTVALLLLEGGHIPTIETNDFGADADYRSEADDRNPRDQTELGSSQGDGVTPTAPEATENKMLFIVLAGVLGLAGFLWLRRRRHGVLQLLPVGEPSGDLGPELGENRVWLLEDGARRMDCMIGLARARNACGRVLLCPRSESRAALRVALSGVGSVCWAEVDRPSPAQLGQMGRDLLGWGRPLVVVEGTDAIEQPDAEESLGAVIEELLGGFSNEIDLLVLLTPDEQAGDHPTRALTLEELQALGFQEANDG
jgi:hypothetical protein